MSWQGRIEDITREGDPDQLVTVAKAAELLAVSTQTVRRMRLRGELRSVKISERVVRYRLGDVRQLIRERTS